MQTTILKKDFINALTIGGAMAGKNKTLPILESAKVELINHTTGFEGYPEGLRQVKNPYYFPDGIGDNGSDFTVGAVFVNKRIGNFFKGDIGGIAIYDRALSAEEVEYVSWWEKN